MKEFKLDTGSIMKEMMFDLNKRMSRLEGLIDNLMKNQSDKRKEKVIFGGIELEQRPKGRTIYASALQCPDAHWDANTVDLATPS